MTLPGRQKLMWYRSRLSGRHLSLSLDRENGTKFFLESEPGHVPHPLRDSIPRRSTPQIVENLGRFGQIACLHRLDIRRKGRKMAEMGISANAEKYMINAQDITKLRPMTGSQRTGVRRHFLKPAITNSNDSAIVDLMT